MGKAWKKTVLKFAEKHNKQAYDESVRLSTAWWELRNKMHLLYSRRNRFSLCCSGLVARPIWRSVFSCVRGTTECVRWFLRSLNSEMCRHSDHLSIKRGRKYRALESVCSLCEKYVENTSFLNFYKMQEKSRFTSPTIEFQEIWNFEFSAPVF